MARRALGQARLRLVQALQSALSEDDRALLVACSGGPDSLALADAAVTVAGRRGSALSGVVVDHRLQTGSREVAWRASRQLVELGVSDALVVEVDVVDDGRGPEAAAREARYDALREQADRRGATVLLGHTRDDQAETVLLGLARGSGIRSLAGMPARSGPFLRPLLAVPRSVTTAACVEAGIEFWTDPHNADPAYARSRVRHRVLPELETELGPGIAEALARTADLARDDADLLDALAAEAAAGLTGGSPYLARPAGPDCDGLDCDGLDCDGLAGLPRPLRRRILLRWLEDRGARDLGRVHAEAVDALVVCWHGQGRVDVPGLSVVRRAGRLCVDATH